MSHCFSWLPVDWLRGLRALKCQRLIALFVRLALFVADKQSLVASQDGKSYYCQPRQDMLIPGTMDELRQLDGLSSLSVVCEILI